MAEVTEAAALAAWVRVCGSVGGPAQVRICCSARDDNRTPTPRALTRQLDGFSGTTAGALECYADGAILTSVLADV